MAWVMHTQGWGFWEAVSTRRWLQLTQHTQGGARGGPSAAVMQKQFLFSFLKLSAHTVGLVPVLLNVLDFP